MPRGPSRLVGFSKSEVVAVTLIYHDGQQFSTLNSWTYDVREIHKTLHKNRKALSNKYFPNNLRKLTNTHKNSLSSTVPEHRPNRIRDSLPKITKILEVSVQPLKLKICLGHLSGLYVELLESVKLCWNIEVEWLGSGGRE